MYLNRYMYCTTTIANEPLKPNECDWVYYSSTHIFDLDALHEPGHAGVDPGVVDPRPQRQPLRPRHRQGRQQRQPVQRLRQDLHL